MLRTHLLLLRKGATTILLLLLGRDSKAYAEEALLDQHKPTVTTHGVGGGEPSPGRLPRLGGLMLNLGFTVCRCISKPLVSLMAKRHFGSSRFATAIVFVTNKVLQTTVTKFPGLWV